MGGGVTGMIRRGEQGFRSGIQLERPDSPVSVLAVPAGHHRIVPGNALNRVSASRAWSIILHPVLEDFLIQEIGPKRYCSPLPEEAFAFRNKGGARSRQYPGEALGFRELGRFLCGIACRRRARPEFASTGKHPGLPRSCERFGWIYALPIAWAVWDGSIKNRAGSIGLGSSYNESCHRVAQIHACLDVSWVLYARQQPRPASCVSLGEDRLGVGWK